MDILSFVRELAARKDASAVTKRMAQVAAPLTKQQPTAKETQDQAKLDR
jgi:hypothetical protein